MKIYTYKTAAEVLDCSAWTVRQIVKTGKIPYFKVGNEIRITEEDLQAWIQRQRRINCSEGNPEDVVVTQETHFVPSR